VGGAGLAGGAWGAAAIIAAAARSVAACAPQAVCGACAPADSHPHRLPLVAGLATEVTAGEALISKDVNGFIQKISVVSNQCLLKVKSNDCHS
jgi:hypothetical protein